MLKKKIIGISIVVCAFQFAKAQVTNTATMDTTNFNYQGKVIVNGYVDAYYGYDFNKPASSDRPYFVSMARHNEFAINLAYVDVKYGSSRLRARFVPGFGTYINANYEQEPGALKNIVEANIGVKLFPNKKIWLDAGVLGSPYTNESAISKDHLMYTRSFAPEYVPYYLSGLKLTVPLGSKLSAYLYLLNGWQQIQDQNQSKSVGTQLEYRPGNHLLLNWNTYFGKENTSRNPENGMRYFSDVFFIYAKGKWSATGCAYAGIQEKNQNNTTDNLFWWQANVMTKFSFNDKYSLSGRIEYFSDDDGAITNSLTFFPGGLTSYSTGLCLNVQIASNIVARFEGRSFFSPQEVYVKNALPTDNSHLLISNLTIWF